MQGHVDNIIYYNIVFSKGMIDRLLSHDHAINYVINLTINTKNRFSWQKTGFNMRDIVSSQ